MSDNLPAKPGQTALDVLGVQAADPNLPAVLAELSTDTLRACLIEEADKFTSRNEIWKRRIGAVLWELRPRLRDADFSEVVGKFANETGFSSRSVYRWIEVVEGFLGRREVPSGSKTGRPKGALSKPKAELPPATLTPLSKSDPYEADDVPVDAEIVEDPEPASPPVHEGAGTVQPVPSSGNGKAFDSAGRPKPSPKIVAAVENHRENLTTLYFQYDQVRTPERMLAWLKEELLELSQIARETGVLEQLNRDKAWPVESPKAVARSNEVEPRFGSKVK